MVYHLRQINLENKLYGGIILTGGGAQLKHITQITEFVTGINARIGYPNEHLAGGHSEMLMNPMYSTCIGLILRGYHDFESGRLRFAGDSGNYIHVHESEVQAAEESKAAAEPAPQDANEEMNQKIRAKNEKVKGMFDMLKGKFIKMFEDVDDQEIG